MRFSSFAAVSAPLLASTTAAYISAPTFGTDLLYGQGMLNLAAYEIKQAFSGVKSSCTLQNVSVRREWGTLSSSERIAYTNAVLCLMKKPSKSDPTLVPGARSRYDDFVATHINQTLTIHGTANFLSWHRYFVYTYETALREECGYKGYQPYWNWGKYALDPLHSPVFDGSATSMSGNGAYEPHNCTNALPTGLNCIPPGQGGGCVTSGPFKDMVVNLGPVSPTLAEPEVVSQGMNLTYNPRCLKRDISVWVSSQWTTDQNSTDLIVQNPDIYWFQTVMQGDFANGVFGVHTGGHFTFGGDPGGDIFSSPGDPAFFLHHAQIDRTWWIWQNQDLPARLNAISGTITLNNSPPSRNGTLNDYVDLGVNAPPVQIKTLLNTLSGPFCYIYI
ncbi:hypothetical protein F5884DRAFT_381033 [Xylogone sp. PMI_703]|nr:hypothetical protein F5884DRAFT_381033 [Xylogone sp. PMI_703]